VEGTRFWRRRFRRRIPSGAVHMPIVVLQRHFHALKIGSVVWRTFPAFGEGERKGYIRGAVLDPF
jgi:hypothetical protein